MQESVQQTKIYTYKLTLWKKEGCQKIFQEKISGRHSDDSKSERKELNRLLEQVREGVSNPVKLALPRF